MFQNGVPGKTVGPKRVEETEGWRNCILSFMNVLLAKYYWGDKIMEGEMVGTCCIHGKEDRNVYRVQAGNPDEMGVWKIYA